VRQLFTAHPTREVARVIVHPDGSFEIVYEPVDE
jgi:hypothetical protein